MACFIVLIIASIVLVNSSSALVCGPNEVQKSGNNSVSDCCPEPRGQISTCPDPSELACTCSFGHRRDAKGMCIPYEDCPEIECCENEVFVKCSNSPACSEDCDVAHAPYPDGKRCKFIGNVLIAVNCLPACRCIDNFWRKKDGDCVYYDKCPKFTEECDEY